jgi:transposase
MRQQRTHYDKTFKDNAVKLNLERKNVSELARELGIAHPSVISLAERVPRERGILFPQKWNPVTK